MTIIYIIYSIICFCCGALSVYIACRAWNSLALIKKNVPGIEIAMQIFFLIGFSVVPLINVWYLGYIFYHRERIIEKQATWIIIVSQMNEE